MYKLYHNELPIYFDNYRPFLEKIETPYNLRPAPLPVPQVTHVYAEDRLVYKLVEMKNKLAASYQSVLIKLDDITFSLLGFSKYVTNMAALVNFVGWHSVQTDVCDPALHIMGHFLMFPVLWKTIFWNNYA